MLGGKEYDGHSHRMVLTLPTVPKVTNCNRMPTLYRNEQCSASVFVSMSLCRAYAGRQDGILTVVALQKLIGKMTSGVNIERQHFQ